MLYKPCMHTNHAFLYACTPFQILMAFHLSGRPRMRKLEILRLAERVYAWLAMLHPVGTLYPIYIVGDMSLLGPCSNAAAL